MKEITIKIKVDGVLNVFFAECPEIHGCHTQGKNIDQVMTRMIEAIGACGFWTKRPPQRDGNFPGPTGAEK